MYKELRQTLKQSQRESQFSYNLVKFLDHCKTGEWIDINKVFTDNETKWKNLLVKKLKEIIDQDVLWEEPIRRDISFSSDYTKFMVIDVRIKKQPK